MVETILNSSQIEQLLDSLARTIAADISEDSCPALVGIRSRGEILAQRLYVILQDKYSLSTELGTLDITLYRDDLNQMGYQQPAVHSTEIDFDLDDRLIILVDDVLNTGRSARAALDALMDLGRPRAVRLAVLIDRGSRELPIRADYVGREAQVPGDKRVSVYLRETDDREEVVLEGI